MNKILTFALVLGIGSAMANIKKDTTIVEFNDKESNSKVKIITIDKLKDLPKILNLSNVLKSVGVDSNERERAIVMVTKSSKNGSTDTIFVVTKDGKNIKIVSREKPEAIRDTTIIDLGNGTMKDEIITFEKDNSSDNSSNKRSRAPKSFFSKSDFGLYLGLNNFINAAPSSPNLLYDLRPLQSRYIALSFRKNATLVKGKKADLAFSYGPEIAWYNFMLENSNVAVFENDKTSFVKNTKETRKSKLVLPYLNLPVMLNLGFKESKFKIGVGGYVGYRVGGYTREKYASNGGKTKTQGNFGFNNILYGLTTEIGKRNGLTMFFRYDLNPLFKSSQTNLKDIQAFSVGFRL